MPLPPPAPPPLLELPPFADTLLNDDAPPDTFSEFEPLPTVTDTLPLVETTPQEAPPPPPPPPYGLSYPPPEPLPPPA